MAAKLGLVDGRKRGHRMWKARKEKMVEDNKQTHPNLEMREGLSGPPLWKMRTVDWVDTTSGEKVDVYGAEVKKKQDASTSAVQAFNFLSSFH